MASTAETPVVDVSNSFVEDYPDLYDAFLWTAHPGRLEEVRTNPVAHYDVYTPALARLSLLSLYMADRLLTEALANNNGKRPLFPVPGDTAKVASKFRDGMRQGYKIGELLSRPAALSPYVKEVPEPVVNEERFRRQIAIANNEGTPWHIRQSNRVKVLDTVRERVGYICKVTLAPEDTTPSTDGRILGRVEDSYIGGINAGLRISSSMLADQEPTNG